MMKKHQLVCVAFSECQLIYILDVYHQENEDHEDQSSSSSSSSSSLPLLVRRNCSILLNGNLSFGVAFIAVNSILYMFGGGCQDKSFSYDLTSLLSIITNGNDNDDEDDDHHPCCELDFESMKDNINDNNSIKTISSMASKKLLPRAVLIGDGPRICVFSLYLESDTSNFEMYDLSSDTWSSLPEPPIDFDIDANGYEDERESYEVKFYCVENETLFISTPKGSYSIDFSIEQQQQLKWVQCNLPPWYKNSYGNPRAVLKVGDLMISPDLAVYNVTDPAITTEPQQQRLRGDPAVGKGRVLHVRDKAIIRLPQQEEDDERLCACIVEVGHFNDSFRHDLVFDVVLRLSLLKFEEEEEEEDKEDPSSISNRLGVGVRPVVLNSRTFYMDARAYSYRVEIAGAFPV